MINVKLVKQTSTWHTGYYGSIEFMLTFCILAGWNGEAFKTSYQLGLNQEIMNIPAPEPMQLRQAKLTDKEWHRCQKHKLCIYYVSRQQVTASLSQAQALPEQHRVISVNLPHTPLGQPANQSAFSLQHSECSSDYYSSEFCHTSADRILRTVLQF